MKTDEVFSLSRVRMAFLYCASLIRRQAALYFSFCGVILQKVISGNAKGKEMTYHHKFIRSNVFIQPVLRLVDVFEESIAYERSWKLPFNALSFCLLEDPDNWCHSIQITFYHAFAIKLFSFAGLPGRKNNLPALDDRRTRKALSPKTDAEDLNSFKSSS